MSDTRDLFQFIQFSCLTSLSFNLAALIFCGIKIEIAMSLFEIVTPFSFMAVAFFVLGLLLC